MKRSTVVCTGIFLSYLCMLATASVFAWPGAGDPPADPTWDIDDPADPSTSSRFSGVACSGSAATSGADFTVKIVKDGTPRSTIGGTSNPNFLTWVATVPCPDNYFPTGAAEIKLYVGGEVKDTHAINFIWP